MDRRRLILASLGALGGTLLSRSPTWADICFGDPCNCSACSWCVNGRVVVPCPVPLPILPFASDIVALRTAIGTFRNQLGLAPYDWTRIIVPGTWINSRDLIELRVALNGIYAVLGLPGVSWMPGPIWATGPQGWIAAMNQIQASYRTVQALAYRTVRYVWDWREAPGCCTPMPIGTLPSSTVSFASGYVVTHEFADALAHALILSGITADLIAISGVAPQTLAAAISTVLEAAALTVNGPPVGNLASLAYYLRVGSIAAVVAAVPPSIHIVLVGAALAVVGLSLFELWVTVLSRPSPWPGTTGVINALYPPPPLGVAASDLEIQLNWRTPTGWRNDEWQFEVDW